MMHTLLGPEGFRRGMDLYIARHDNHAATIDDFVAAMQDASGVDLGRVHALVRPGRHARDHGRGPLRPGDAQLRADRRADACRRPRASPTRQPMPIPLAMGLLGPNGDEMPTRLDGESDGADRHARAGLPTSARQTFRFVDVAGAAGAVAAARLLGAGEAAGRAARPAEIPGDPRHRPGRALGCRAAGRDPACCSTGSPPHQRGAAAAAARPRSDRGDAADARRCRPRPGLCRRGAGPAERERRSPTRWPSSTSRRSTPCARRPARRSARRWPAALAEAYRALADPGPYRIDGALDRPARAAQCLPRLSRGRRHRRAARGSPRRSSTPARNMTDVLAALAVLVDIDCPERAAALDALLPALGRTIRWSSTNGSRCRRARRCRGTIGRGARADARTRPSPRNNPNRVRALVGTFAQANQLHFHDASGAGYAFLADEVLALDPVNPTTAARLVQPLGQWRRYDAARQALMRARARAHPRPPRPQHQHLRDGREKPRGGGIISRRPLRLRCGRGSA